MSRVPRFQEHLKTGFTAEAVSAARYRAHAARAEREGLSNLAARWLALAAEKDRLAILQLEAAEQVPDRPSTALQDALAEDRYENDVLYPRMAEDVGGDTAGVFQQVVDAQREHLEQLDELRREVQASTGDLS